MALFMEDNVRSPHACDGALLSKYGHIYGSVATTWFKFGSQTLNDISIWRKFENQKDSKENHDFQSWNSFLALFGFNQGSVDSRSSSETILYSKATL